ncbi:MAG: hypothetical protein R3325_12840 [Thermoanaerobaculia bacterium]|nr:hypothetical protein [Thermoanaerobaculia bacterium]
MRPVRLSILAAALVAAVAAPVAAASAGGRGHWGEEQALRLRLGVFEPRGESRYWDEKAIDFTSDPAEFDGLDLGVEYVRFLGNRLGVVAGSSYFYSGEVTQNYRFFVDERGGEILHDTELELARFHLGLLLHLFGRDAAIEPYVGGGVGLTLWKLREVGDFIDFEGGDEIFFGDFRDEGAVFGHYLQAGVEVPVARNWSVFADARWERADDTLGGDFRGLGEIDLSGKTYSLGVAVSF